MSSSPKRPPAPDPNWELELHGPPPGTRTKAPESRDELLAHAVLREPEPLDVFDELGDLERVTVPPPAGMDDHVARMMAEAALIEQLDDEGDRPTPLFEVEPLPSAPGGNAQRPFEPTPRAPLPATRPAVGPAQRPAVGPAQAPRAQPAAGRLTAREPTPAPPPPEPRRSATPLPFAAVRAVEPAPLRPATPPPFAAVRPAARAPTPPPMRAPTPAPMRAPTPAPMRAPTPPPGRVPIQNPLRKPTPAPVAIRPREPVMSLAKVEAPREERRISSLDLEDLPAVFSLDGLSLDDDPVSEPPPARTGGPRSQRAGSGAFAEAGGTSGPRSQRAGFGPQSAAPSRRPESEPAISPSLAMPPASEPAISPPFASLDPVELAAELSDSLRPPAPDSLPPPHEPPTETIAAIEARLAAGDYGRALVLAESALDTYPDHPALTWSANTCRDELYKRYLERLGAADHVPRLAVQSGALTGLSLDHRAGFLLSCVDGGSTVEEIIDVSAMPRLEAVRVLYELLQEGVIEMTSRR